MLAGVFCVALMLFSMWNYRNYQREVEQWESVEEGELLTVRGKVDEFYEREKSSILYMGDRIVLVYKSRCSTVLKRGMYIEVKGEAVHFERCRNQGNYDEKRYYTSLGYTKKLLATEIKVLEDSPHSLTAALEDWKRAYQNAVRKVWRGDRAAVILAMTSGDKENLTGQIKENYQITGLSHMLAISGLHLSVIGMGVFRLLRKRFRYPVSGAAAVFLIVLFGMITGTTASMVRAMIMFSLHILALVFGRTYDMISAAGVALIFLMLQCPYVIYHAGFLLSFLAVAGIITASLVSDSSFFTLFYIQIMTLPAVMYFYYEIPVYGIFVNIVAVPLLSMALVSGFCSGIAGIFSVGLARFAAGIGSAVLGFYDSIAEVVRRLPGTMYVTGQPSLTHILLYYGAVLGVSGYFFWNRERGKRSEGNERKRKGAATRLVLLALPVVLLVVCARDKSFYVTAVDVGQGDCFLIHNEGKSVFMVDAGSSDVSQVYQYRILPFLKAKGIRKIDGLFLSHMDEDHINAAEELLEDGLVNTLYLPDLGEKDAIYKKIEKCAARQNVPVVSIGKNVVVKHGKCSLKCIYPEAGDTGTDKNGLSMVLSLSYGDFSMLFTGDLEEEGERKLTGENISCDVLKAGHHGSKTSSSDRFLEQIQAKDTIVSCGVENRYGHPGRETIERFEKHCVKYYITAEVGEIDIVVGRKGYVVKGYRCPD